jgi:hypothetical protein
MTTKDKFWEPNLQFHSIGGSAMYFTLPYVLQTCSVVISKHALHKNLHIDNRRSQR